MKKIIIIVILLIVNVLIAQKNVKIHIVDEKEKITAGVQEKIELYVHKIDSTIIAEKAFMKIEIDAISLKENQKVITEEMANAQKKEIANKYADRIDLSVMGLQEDLEEIIAQQVSVSIRNTEAIKDQNDSIKKVSQSIEFDISLGFTNLTDNTNISSINKSGVNFGKSSAFAFGANYILNINSKKNWIYTTGLWFKWNSLQTEDHNIFTENEQGEVILEKPEMNIDKSKLRISKLYIPFKIIYSFKNKNQVNTSDKTFKIGAGIYGGFIMGAKQITKYKENDKRQKDRSSDLNVNRIFYGNEFSLGYGNYTLYIQKNWNDLFVDYMGNNNEIEFGVRIGL